MTSKLDFGKYRFLNCQMSMILPFKISFLGLMEFK